MELTIPRRFTGPPSIAHGGYVAGHFAGPLRGQIAARGSRPASHGRAVQVTLHRPTPLDTPLRLTAADETRYELRHDDEVCADGVPTSLDLDIPSPPDVDEARAAATGSPSHFNGSGVHPTCFGCSVLRAADDGLAIAAGPCTVDGQHLVAAAWTPGPAFVGECGRVDERHVVAALDCPGAFAFMVDDEQPGLLGRISFEIRTPLVVGDTYVVTGWQVGRDGRKLFAGTAIHGPDGTCHAAAEATWFVVDWSRLRPTGDVGTSR